MEGKPAEIFRRGEELLALGLDVPTTARCAMLLKERGIQIDTDFTCDDFVRKGAFAVRGREGGQGGRRCSMT